MLTGSNAIRNIRQQRFVHASSYAPVQPTIADDNRGVIATTQIQKVAVLLPLSGKLAGPASALKAGLEQANLASR